MRIYTILTGLLLLGGQFLHAATTPAARQYLDEFTDLAISESHRSNIPASIILAQGALESSWGMGKLALEARNHFGIKCKSEWMGQRYFHEDDDYDSQGNLEESCFRVYDSAHQSYLDHTDFLLYREYYKDCFNYDRTDYRNWAKALKRAGYATDPFYAQKLIRIIEENELYLYDQPVVRFPVAQLSVPVEPVVTGSIVATPQMPILVSATPTAGRVTGQTNWNVPPAPYASRSNGTLRQQRRTYVAHNGRTRIMTSQRRSRIRRR